MVWEYHIRVHESHGVERQARGQASPHLSTACIYIYYMYIYLGQRAQRRLLVGGLGEEGLHPLYACVYSCRRQSNPVRLSTHVRTMSPPTYCTSRRKTRLVDGVEERNGAGVQDRVREGQGQLQIHQRVRGAMDLAVYVCCGICARVVYLSIYLSRC